MKEIYTTRNAIITGAEITNDYHGLLSAWVYLDYGDGGQGFGGYSLYLTDDFSHAKDQKNVCGLFIWRVMEVAGVNEWSQLNGREVRVIQSDSNVKSIGHIIKDIWFDPESEFMVMNGDGDSTDQPLEDLR